MNLAMGMPLWLPSLLTAAARGMQRWKHSQESASIEIHPSDHFLFSSRPSPHQISVDRALPRWIAWINAL